MITLFIVLSSLLNLFWLYTNIKIYKNAEDGSEDKVASKVGVFIYGVLLVSAAFATYSLWWA